MGAFPRRRPTLAGLAFTSPAWIVLVFVIVIPLIVAAMTSLTNENLTSVLPPKDVGLRNYQTRVFSDDFLHNLIVTIEIIVLSLLVQIPIGMALALALVKPFRGRALARTLIALPMLLTPIAVGLMWKFVANPDLGVVRLIAEWIDPTARPNVFADSLASLGLIVFVNSWINVPFVTLALLAGLVGIPGDLYEAAAIDGAGRIASFLNVTIPLIMPVLLTTVAIRAVADYRMFDLVYTITKGGPGDATVNLSMRTYQEALLYFTVGRASALAIAMAILALPAYWLFSRVTRP